MFQPKLRSILASAALVSTLSLLSVQTVDAAPRAWRTQREGGAFSERIERWGILAWDFLTGLLEKRSSNINPDGLLVNPTDDGD